MNNLPKYPAYKPSGVEWLGEIPEHWEVTRLGKILSPNSKRNQPELPLLSITREKGVILRDLDNEEENHNYIPDDLSNYKILGEGQFGMNKMKAWQGSYGISDYTGIVSPAYFVFELIDKIEPRYFHIAIRSKLYISFFGSASDGVRIGQWDLSKERMKEIPFLIPSKEEQTTIASFLDHKTALIDQAIVIKEKQIELLKERRQILIHRAVTRGLNPNVKLKESGMEWIGEIPEHWEVVPVRRLIDVRDGTHDTPLYIEDGDDAVPLVTSKDFEGDEINFENIKKISKKDHLNISKRSGVAKADVLMSMIGGNIGKSVIIGDFNDFSVKNVALFKCKGDLLLAKYLRYYFDSGILQNQIDLKSRGGAQGFLSLGDIRNLIFFMMSYEERTQIVDYLEQNISTKIATAISLKEQEIEKLKEYKASLIDAAVTGKIKVS